MSAVTIDLIVLTAVAVAMVRGWAHGSIREFFSLGGIFLGILAAPWLVGPLASLLDNVFDLDINMARVIALAVTVGVISIAGAIVGVRASGIEVSGPRFLERFGGTMFALIRSLTLVSLIFYGIFAVAAPAEQRGSFAAEAGDSVSGQLLADPDSPFTIAYDGLLSRSEDLEALTLWVRQRSVFEEEVPGERLDFAATNEELIAVAGAEERMFELLNQERVDRDLEPLRWCAPCADVARGHSKNMYRNGYFSHIDTLGDDPFDRMQNAGITYEAAGENLSIAPTVMTGHTSLMESPDHRENILRDLFDSVGIGCYEGPYGFMCTQVFRTTPS
ncbi:MAG TPA: CvpA family protein [Actinomycetota bacterium]|nr:CvpA family protein [Actinomycetota bacterium]